MEQVYFFLIAAWSRLSVGFWTEKSTQETLGVFLIYSVVLPGTQSRPGEKARPSCGGGCQRKPR